MATFETHDERKDRMSLRRSIDGNLKKMQADFDSINKRMDRLSQRREGLSVTPVLEAPAQAFVQVPDAPDAKVENIEKKMNAFEKMLSDLKTSVFGISRQMLDDKAQADQEDVFTDKGFDPAVLPYNPTKSVLHDEFQFRMTFPNQTQVAVEAGNVYVNDILVGTEPSIAATAATTISAETWVAVRYARSGGAVSVVFSASHPTTDATYVYKLLGRVGWDSTNSIIDLTDIEIYHEGRVDIGSVPGSASVDDLSININSGSQYQIKNWETAEHYTGEPDLDDYMFFKDTNDSGNIKYMTWTSFISYLASDLGGSIDLSLNETYRHAKLYEVLQAQMAGLTDHDPRYWPYYDIAVEQFIDNRGFRTAGSDANVWVSELHLSENGTTDTQYWTDAALWAEVTGSVTMKTGAGNFLIDVQNPSYEFQTGGGCNVHFQGSGSSGSGYLKMGEDGSRLDSWSAYVAGILLNSGAGGFTLEDSTGATANIGTSGNPYNTVALHAGQLQFFPGGGGIDYDGAGNIGANSGELSLSLTSGGTFKCKIVNGGLIAT